MRNFMREKIGKKDVMMFADYVEKDLVEAKGDELSILSRAVGYPIRLEQKVVDNALVPEKLSVGGLYADSNLIDPNKEPQVETKHVEIKAPNKTDIGCSLTYKYKKYYYKDPNDSDQVNEIKIPDIDYSALPEVFDFCIKYFESIEDFRRYIYIILITNPHIVEQGWPGTGWSLFEKITGSSVSLGYTRLQLQEQLKKQNIPTNELDNELNELEMKKRIAAIELGYNALHTHKFIKGLKTVKQLIIDSMANRTLKDGEELITTVQSSEVEPIKVQQTTQSFTEINGVTEQSRKKLNRYF